MTSIQILTLIHTALCLIALAIGFPVLKQVLSGTLASRQITWFLALAVLATLTGFFFPFTQMTPAFATGIVSTLIFIAMFGAQKLKIAFWRKIYAVGLVLSQYLLVFVTIAQAFQKIPALHALAPTLSEPPFGISQLIALAVFGFLSVKAFRRSN